MATVSFTSPPLPLHDELNFLLVFSERITVTQKLQLTLEMVSFACVLFCIARFTETKLDPREYCISTKDFVVDEDGKLAGLNTGILPIRSLSKHLLMFHIVRVEWTKESGGRWKMEEIPGSEKFFSAQLVFLALGFLGPESDVIKALGVKQDGRSNIQTPPKVSNTATFTIS